MANSQNINKTTIVSQLSKITLNETLKTTCMSPTKTRREEKKKKEEEETKKRQRQKRREEDGGEDEKQLVSHKTPVS